MTDPQLGSSDDAVALVKLTKNYYSPGRRWLTKSQGITLEEYTKGVEANPLWIRFDDRGVRDSPFKKMTDAEINAEFNKRKAEKAARRKASP
jgi:hypothetical protein